LVVTQHPLADFLRAKRRLLEPATVGIPAHGRRQVPGLRREELAMLAGISADYYTRLEQGRDQHPSAQVLDALASALQLDHDSTRHLHQLAQQRPARAPRRQRDNVDPTLSELIDNWPLNPAYISNKFWDVLISNPLAATVHPCYRPGHNLLRHLFLDRAAQDFYLNWHDLARSAVAALHAAAADDPTHPRLIELVGELSVRSSSFAQLWPRHDIHAKTRAIKHLHHPMVGPLALTATTLVISGTPSHQLVVFQAQQGTPDHDKLTALNTLISTPPNSDSNTPPPN
jgi:transcriptional regulator with XRE-family HTH domain